MTMTADCAPVEASAKAAKYLTFTLRDESYGVPVLAVREIIPLAPVTPVPKLPDYVEGVINLRGKIIPVVHLGMRFGFERSEPTDKTCIIVVQVSADSGPPAPYGLIVDVVEEVLALAAEQIEPTPAFHSAIDTSCIAGLVNIDGSVKTLLNINHTLWPQTVA